MTSGATQNANAALTVHLRTAWTPARVHDLLGAVWLITAIVAFAHDFALAGAVSAIKSAVHLAIVVWAPWRKPRQSPARQDRHHQQEQT